MPPQIDQAVFDLGIPVLGICYGHQLMSRMLGGKVEPGETREYGKADLTIVQNKGLLSNFEPRQQTQVWMSHGDTVTELAPSFEVLASTLDCKNAVIGDLNRKLFGIQFHPEVNHSLEGSKMIDAFLEVCNCDRDWQLPDYLNHKIAEIKTQTEGKNVFLLISGGVDSTVAFALLSQAIGADRVHGLLVDTGFMRKNEVTQVTAALKGIGVKNLTVYNAHNEYFTALKGIYDPETKRKIIGQIFVDIKDKLADEMGLDDTKWLLGQGTIYPDTIESGGTKHADKIKTHHNRIDRIQELINQGKVIEPLSDLYKDEVREIGKLLGLPADLINRHPFPGPGLAVRVLCAEKADLPTDNDTETAKIQAYIEAKGYQLQTRILPIKSVGVQGDSRTYRHPLAIYDHLAQYEPQKLLKLATDLTNQFAVINRVTLSLTPLSQNVDAVYPTYLTPERVAVLQEADAIFNDTLKKHDLYQAVWQAPVVLIPVTFDGTQSESIVLRPVASTEAMTADAFVLPKAFLTDYLEQLKEAKLPISGVFYDLTHKPPGTIEWE